MKTEAAEPPMPAEVLIPEARQHQRRRYRRGGLFVVVTVFVLAALLVSGLLLLRGPAAENKARSNSNPGAAAGTAGLVYFRPLLCFAAPYAAPTATTGAVVPSGTGTIPACAPGSLLSAANLGIVTATGQDTNSVPPDPQYAPYPSTSGHKPGYSNSVVLLPGVASACDTGRVRCVLGPSQMSSRAIGAVTATRNRTGQWLVDFTMKGGAGAALWDKVLSMNFHQLLAVEVGGVVYTAPIIQPTQSSFSSFEGRGELSGSLTRSEAVHLAEAIRAHEG